METRLGRSSLQIKDFAMWETFIIQPFTNLLLWIYSLLAGLPGAFGWAIILFTILIRAVTWPLNAQQLKGAQAMQDLQNDKDWQAIQKKYAKDREKLAQEQMRIYKEKGINPFSSCLPTLIQFPIIIGLYQAIIRALASAPLGLLQLARIVYPTLSVAALIPLNSHFLWMDLGQPEFIPVFGFNLPTLAIIVAITTYIQSKLTMPATSSPGDQGAAMGKTMSIYMPLMLGYFALTFASGLSVYFVTSNLLGIFQYAITGRANWRNLLPGGIGGNAQTKTK
jgi:YidC/Oxa1 family membrane protein insertase